MAARIFNGIFNADYACASDADDVPRYSRLRDQVLKRRVKVERPLLLSCLTVTFLPTAFAMPANIHGQRVDSRRRELAGDHIPLLTRPVALMIQQNSRTGFRCRKIGAFQNCAVVQLEIYGAAAASSVLSKRDNSKDECRQKKLDLHLFHCK